MRGGKHGGSTAVAARWRMRAASVAPAALLVMVGTLFGLAGASPARAAQAADWAAYLNGAGGSGFNAAETTLTPSSAANLKLQWTDSSGGTVVSTQPVMANGLIYWGSWDGVLHATRPDGTTVWTAGLGITPVPPACTGRALGVLGTPSVATVTVNGSPRSLVLVAGGQDVFYGLDAATGAVVWQRQLATSPSEIWDSPVLYNGSVYIGMASFGDCPLTQAQIFQLDAATGAIQHTFNVVPNGCVGAGVWGSLTVDAAAGSLFFATGNGGPCSQAEPLGEAVVELNAADLSLQGSWQVPAAQALPDGDFGSTPTLFTATIGGTPRHLVGVANKNGIYYALDEAQIGAGPVWEDVVAVGGDAPETGKGSISPSMWDGSTLYVAGGNTTINGVSCKGGVRAVNPATGAYLWQDCLGDGFVLGAVSGAPGVVTVAAGSALEVLAASDGHMIARLLDPHGGSYFGGACIANGAIYIGNSDGDLNAYALSAAPTPTPSPSPSPSPTPTNPPVGGTPNAVEDNFTRANQAGWGGSTNAGGVPAVAWGVDGSGGLASVQIGGDRGVYGYPGAINQVGIAAAGAAARDGGDALALLTLSATGHATPYITLDACADKSCYYGARIHSSQGRLELARRSGGVTTVLASVAFAPTAGTAYWLRLDVAPGSPTTLRAKVWPAGTTEPAAWMVSTSDAAPLAANLATAGGTWDLAGPGETIAYACYAYAPSGNLANPCA